MIYHTCIPIPVEFPVEFRFPWDTVGNVAKAVALTYLKIAGQTNSPITAFRDDLTPLINSLIKEAVVQVKDVSCESTPSGDRVGGSTRLMNVQVNFTSTIAESGGGVHVAMEIIANCKGFEADKTTAIPAAIGAPEVPRIQWADHIRCSAPAV